MFRLLIALLLSGLCCCSSDRQAQRKGDSFDLEAKELMKELRLPGLAVATVSFRESAEPLVWMQTYGKANIEKALVVEEETPFWLGSITKTFTGFAVAKAVEDGALRLDDEVNELLADFGAPFLLDHPYRKRVTLLDLVTHSSGIIDTREYGNAYLTAKDPLDSEEKEFGSLFSVYKPKVTLAHFDELNRKRKLNLEAFLTAYLQGGETLYSTANFIEEVRPEYSNIASALAGYLVELATGVPLENYLQEHLLVPLEMQSTFLNWSPNRPEERFAIQYVTHRAPITALPQYNLATWPDGAIRSSIADMSRFLTFVMQAHLNPESNRGDILGREALSLMLTPQRPLEEDVTIGTFWQTQQLDFSNSTREVIGHDGTSPGAFAFMLFDPKRKLGVIILANGSPGDEEDLLLEFIERLFLRAARGR